MRPIKLTISAFGPYGGVETIDFREATDAGLFGIYGPTGSGKSSIFSAIAFALFGEGAKEEQGIGTMRSDFADDALLTEVSLQFELGAKRYYVRRIPDQPRPKTRGEGHTLQPHAAWLFDVSSVAIDDVGPDCSGVPLAVLPHGTGNLLARNLNLALDDLPGAVAAAFDGVTRPVDVAVARLLRLEGTAEEHVFVVMAGMGLDAQIMSTTDERLKRRVGMLAYVKAGAEALLRDRRMRVSYQFDDGSFGSARLHTVMIGNCGSIGGNVMLMPDALVDDGILDILAVRPQGLFGWVRVAWRVLVDNAFVGKMLPGRESRTDRTREFLYRQAERVQLRLRGPEEIELDGDHLGEVVEVEIAVDPGALLVRMPAGWEPQAP